MTTACPSPLRAAVSGSSWGVTQALMKGMTWWRDIGSCSLKAFPPRRENPRL